MKGKDLLKKMDECNFFVHAIAPGELLPGIPIAHQNISTHYLMHDSEIIFVGTAQGAINFVNKYKPDSEAINEHN